MFGTVGTPEMVFIFLLALLLFGPKKLPEIGRTVGKAIGEFRRASNELKATFDREMKSLEAETQSLKTEVGNPYQYDTYNYDYASYDNSYEEPYAADNHDANSSNPATISATATEGAESPSAVAIEGTVAHGSEPVEPAEPHGEHTTAEHNA